MRGNWSESIRETALKIKAQMSRLRSDILFVFIVIFVGLGSFALGRLSMLEESRPAIQMHNVASVSNAINNATNDEPIIIGGQVVASQRGSKYHFPWCSGAKAMNDENKIWFDSIEEARAAGYSPAGNCKGLK
jgi:hypothetical protein